MFDEVDLHSVYRPETVRVATIQLELSREQLALPGKSLSPDALRGLRTRVERTLDEVAPHKPDIVHFPECSLPVDLLPHVRSWSKTHGAIVIAGTHYVDEGHGYISKCPVIFPDGKEYQSEKHTIGPLEKSPTPGKRVVPGVIQFSFNNTRAGNFMVLICADALEHDIESTISQLSPDIVFVSACQRVSRRYHSSLADICVNSVDGVFISYSNTRCPDIGDGHSAMFAVTDKVYLPAFKNDKLTDLVPEEKVWQAKNGTDFGIFELKIDEKKVSLPKSAYSEPNIRVEATRASPHDHKDLAPPGASTY